MTLKFEVTNRYQILVVDPPWRYTGSPTKWGAVEKFYSTMSDDEIISLPVRDWLDEPSVVFLWTTQSKMGLAYKCIENWGLWERGPAFIWVKTRKSDGQPIGAMGVRPSIVKPTTEFVLAASTKKKGRPLPIADEGVPQVVLAPRGAHSQKPEMVQDRIEKLYPYASRAELFARRRRNGWDCYGDEI